ncbi:unnamed protein product [Peniophora sp. CBMAI 1063]|nr:unnamed protein product [Peniophora sp. CBMAI 1063]
MDIDSDGIVERAVACAQALKDVVKGLPAQTFGGDLGRDFILEACGRAEGFEPRLCNIDFPPDFLPGSRLPRKVVGILGGTGVGKSKLLVELLGKNVLPTSGNKRGTFFPTIIVYHPLPTIEAAVSFMSKEDFEKHVATAIDIVKPDDSGTELVEVSLKRDPSYSLLTEALRLDRRAFREEGVTVETILDKRPEVREVLGRTDRITADNEKNFLRDTVKRYNRSTGHSQYKPWPLVNLMVIKCNAEILSKGVVLVDLPGSHDVSATVQRATDSFKDKLQFTLATARVDRSQEDASLQGPMDDEVIRQQRMQSGSDGNNVAGVDPVCAKRPSPIAPALAVIITRCDSTTNVKLEELEQDDEIGSLLAGNVQYSTLSARSEEIQTRMEDIQNGIGDESDSDGPPVSEREGVSSHPLKRSQPDDSANPPSAKRQKTHTAEGSTMNEPTGADSSSQDMDVDEGMPLSARLNACDKRRKIIASGMRAQVICRAIRKQYQTKAAAALQGDAAPLPVFATSAEDFSVMQRDILLGTIDATTDPKRTGVPAVRAFVRSLGAREQYAAALELVQSLLVQVTSVLNFLSAIETQDEEATMPQKRALMQNWATQGPTAGTSSQGSASSEPQTTPVSAGGIRARLEETLRVALHSEIQRVHRKLDDLASACDRPLTDLTCEHVPQITKEIIECKQHWATWRAFLRHNGVYGKDNWNRSLARPLVKSIKAPRHDMYNQWNKVVLPNIRNELIQAGAQISNDIIGSTDGYDAALVASVKEHVNRARSIIFDAPEKLKKIVTAEIHETDEPQSRMRSLSVAVETCLSAIYARAYSTFSGRNVTARQKTFIEEAINEKADTMFAEIVNNFLRARRDTIDRVERKLRLALERTAKQAELAISPVWAVVGHDAAQIAARARASESVSAIRERLLEMERTLEDALERVERNIPSCYPAPTIPDSE